MSSSTSILHLPHVPALSWEDCRLLVESVVDYAIFMLDVEGRVATWNPGAEKIKGYSASEIIGEHFSKFFPAEDVAAGKPEDELRLATEHGRFEDESWRVRKDGTRFWANVIITALRDETGKLRGFGKLTRDLTARRVAETKLLQAEEQFHKLVDAITDYAIYMLDADGNVTTWSAGAQRIKGYSADEIVGRHFSIFYGPEDRSAGKPEQILKRVREQGRFEEENWRVRKDGSRFWANVVLTALHEPGGNLIGFAKITRDLTERRHEAEELRRSEERFRLLVENVGDYAIYVLDSEGRVTTWNLGAERMKGYGAAEIIGQSFERFFPAEDIAFGKPSRELALARAQGRFEDEGWRVRKDGSRFWANAILTALRDHSGALIGFAKITRDLTARRQAEENDRKLLRERTAREVAEQEGAKLRESEQRYRALSQRLEIVFEGVAEAITVQDRSGRVVLANTAAAKMCGFSQPAELLRASPAELVARFELLDTEGRPFPVAELPGRRVLLGEGRANATLLVRELATRNTRWVQIWATAVPGDDGATGLAINIWHDITAERQHETYAKFLAQATAALGRSLVYDEMLSTLANVLVPVMADWCSIYVLEGEQLHDVAAAHADPSKRAAVQEYRERFPSDPEHAAGVWGVLRTGNTAVFNDIDDATLRDSTSDPEALVALRRLEMKAACMVPIRARDRLLGVIAGVHAQSNRRYEPADVALMEELGRRAGVALENAQLYRASQDAARAASEAARRAEQSARAADEASRSKDEFLATVSHELRTPLNAILGWSSLLKSRMHDAAATKAIEVIHRNAEAQARIIEDILDMSRVITGKFRVDPKPMDLLVVVRDAIEVVRPSAVGKQIALVLVPEQDPCLLVADPERLQQVAWNLLSNAVKFTQPGGSIQVSIRQEGSYIVLAVQDTGQGIDPAFLPFVFDRFKQADSSTTRRFGGLGLGLALVRHIVELHGGRVGVTSPGAGQGATFSITLPIRAVTTTGQTPSRERDEPARPSPTNHVTLGGVRVLVVDDEPDARDLIGTVLMEAGAEVQTAGSAQEGFEAFKHFHPDVLVSDIGMPDEDGFSFISRIRALPLQEGARIPALALTAFAREEDRSKALRVGYTAHVGKPVDPEVLTSAVANLAAVRHRG